MFRTLTTTLATLAVLAVPTTVLAQPAPGRGGHVVVAAPAPVAAAPAQTAGPDLATIFTIIGVVAVVLFVAHEARD